MKRRNFMKSGIVYYAFLRGGGGFSFLTSLALTDDLLSYFVEEYDRVAGAGMLQALQNPTYPLSTTVITCKLK